MSTAIVSLGDLARQINESEKRIAGLKTQAVEEAVKQGNLLARAKAQLPHGEFTPWVEANCAVNPRQARTYMKLAAGVAGLPEPERKAVLGGGIEAAVKTLKTKTAVTADLPKDETKPVDAAPEPKPKPKPKPKTAVTADLPDEPQPAAPAFDLASVSDDDLLAEVQRRLEADVVAMGTRVAEGEKINYQGIPKKDVALLKRFKRDYQRFYDVSAAAWGLIAEAVAMERTEAKHGEALKRIAKQKDEAELRRRLAQDAEVQLRAFQVDPLAIEASAEEMALVRSLLQFCHPDKHQNTPEMRKLGEELMQKLIPIRERQKRTQKMLAEQAQATERRKAAARKGAETRARASN